MQAPSDSTSASTGDGPIRPALSKTTVVSAAAGGEAQLAVPV